jgi:phage terminase small subunit
MNNLSPKQEKFCQEYINTGNATQSYINAGYSKTGADAGASRLLGNVSIKDRLEELKAEAQKEFKVDRKFLYDGYMELIEKHKDLTPAVAKGSYDSIAKMFGLNEAEKVELSGKIEGFKIVLDEGD